MKKSIKLGFLLAVACVSINVLAGIPSSPKYCDLGTDCVFNPSKENAWIGLKKEENSKILKYVGTLENGRYTCQITQRYSQEKSRVSVASYKGWDDHNSFLSTDPEFPLEEGKITTINISISYYRNYYGFNAFINVSVYKSSSWYSIIPVTDPNVEVTANCKKN